MARARLEAGVVHGLDAGVGGEEAGHAQGGLVLPPHAQIQRLHPAEQEIGGPRVEAGAEDLAVVVERFHEVGPAAGHPAHRVLVPAQELGRAVEHEVGPERERPRVDRRGEGVVDDHRRSRGVAGLGEAGDVEDLQRRVGGGLEIEHAAAAGDLPQDRVVVGGVAEARLDAEPRKELREHPRRAAVGVLTETTRSPGRRRAKRVPEIAAMPEANAMAASAPSSRRTLSSKTLTVGLSFRL